MAKRLEIDEVWAVSVVDKGAVNRPFFMFKRAPVEKVAVSDTPWSQVDKTDLPAACFLYVGDAEKKSTWKLPVYESADGARGTLNRNAVHAAAAALAGARGGVSISDDDKKKIAQKLVRLYGSLKEDPPESLLALAGVEKRGGGAVKMLDGLMTSVAKAVREFFGAEEADLAKQDATDFGVAMVQNTLGQDLWELNDTLRTVVLNIVGDSSIIDKQGQIATALDQFKTKILALVSQAMSKRAEGDQSGDISKNGGEEDVTQEELQKAIEAALEPVNKTLGEVNQRIESLEKGNEPSKEPTTEESIAKALEPITKAAEDLGKRVEALEKAKAPSKQLKGDSEPVGKKAGKFAGML